MSREVLRGGGEIGKKTSFKHLRLMTPEAAHKWGITLAETPVFISPNVPPKARCEECGETCGPVIYVPGRDIEGHDWHRPSGGIYFLETSGRRRFPRVVFEKSSLEIINLKRFTGWVAILEPSDPKTPISWESCFRNLFLGEPLMLRSPKVFVERILAFCVHCSDEGYHHPADQLTAGWACSLDLKEPFLYPVCDMHIMQNADPTAPRFQFVVGDNSEVFFSLPRLGDI